MKVGKVFLVGAGPGDPDLLTLRAHELLKKADVVVHDRLIPPLALLDLNPSARLVDVGKEPTRHRRPQDEIDSLLVREAQAGNMVVRLKGGDGFVFGRGGEEALALKEANIPFEVIPGVTSAIAAPAYAGIPVTHRGTSTEFAVVAGHEDPSKPESTIDWPHLARGVGTLILLMGVKNLSSIVRRLVDNGRDPATPAAIIQWGCWGSQRVIESTLEKLPFCQGIETFTPPSITIVGHVAALRSHIGAWWENLPLHGRRFLITRREQDSRDIGRLLFRQGAEIAISPLVRTVPRENQAALQSHLGALASFSWLLFTSRTGVDIFFERLDSMGMDSRALSNVRIGAIGPATAESLRRRGIYPDLVPSRYTAEGLLEALSPIEVAGHRVLIPRASRARTVLVEELTARGALVTEVVTYDTLPASQLTDEGRHFLEHGVDAVLLFSPSAVEALNSLIPNDMRPPVAAVGPITGARARELGYPILVESDEHTGSGLIDALISMSWS